MTNKITTASEFLTRLCYGYVSEYALRDRYGYALHLSPNGLARVGQIAGWITGLRHAGQPEMADKLAEDFDRVLKQACASGESVDVPVVGSYSGEPEGSVRVPRMKVVVGDDGTFGGFTLAWYGLVMPERVAEVAKEIDPTAWTSDEDGVWRRALDAAHAKLNTRKELEEYRTYRPASRPPEDNSPYNGVYVHYGFMYNGGMLYSGPGGGEIFSVNLTPVSGWSIHT